MEKMKIEYRSVDSITPYANNPRDNAGAVSAVAESIKRFGFTQPIVIDSNGEIVVGHTRYLAAKSLGMKLVPVVVAGDLKPEQIKAYRIADNRLAEIATWNESFLYDELVSADDEFTGFSDEEISALFEKYEKTGDGSAANTSPATGNTPLNGVVPESGNQDLFYEIAFESKDDKAVFDSFFERFSGDVDDFVSFIEEKLYGENN